jgi:hypothetical protein
LSFTLEVLAPSFPDDLGSRWPEALAKQGLSVEVYPRFRASTGGGRFLPFKLTVRAGAFPAAERYGPEPVLAGFELDFSSTGPGELEELAEGAEAELAGLLRSARAVAILRTAMGRTVADLRLQCFAAATLAKLCCGVVLDEQQGKYFFGSATLANASREAEAYEREPVPPEDWDLIAFPGWAALEPPGSEGAER